MVENDVEVGAEAEVETDVEVDIKTEVEGTILIDVDTDIDFDIKTYGKFVVDLATKVEPKIEA